MPRIKTMEPRNSHGEVNIRRSSCWSRAEGTLNQGHEHEMGKGTDSGPRPKSTCLEVLGGGRGALADVLPQRRHLAVQQLDPRPQLQGADGIGHDLRQRPLLNGDGAASAGARGSNRAQLGGECACKGAIIQCGWYRGQCEFGGRRLCPRMWPDSKSA